MRRTRRPRVDRAHRASGRWPTLDPEIRGDLDDFSRAIEALSSGDFQRLIAFWDDIAPEARDAAHVHAQAAAARSDRRDVIHALQEELLGWASPSAEARTGRVEGWLPATGQEGDQYARRHALPALLDTALALAVQDELGDADFETLFGPWRDAMGDEGDEEDEARAADAARDPATPPPIG